MYCPKCGSQNSDNVSFCTQCGASVKTPPQPQSGFPRPQLQSPQYPPPHSMGPPPDNKLTKAILVTILCCLPLGIVAIINAAQVSSKWAAGDFEGAKHSAAQANKWANYSIYVGIAVGAIYIIIGILSEF